MTDHTAALERRGLVFLFIGTVGMSLIPIMAQIVMQSVPPRHFTGVWMAFASVWAAVFILSRGTGARPAPVRALAWPLFAAGVCATAWVYLYFYGIARLDAAVATFLINSRILWGTLLAVILFHERIGLLQAIGTVTTIAGITLVFAGDFSGGDPAAMIAVVCAGFFYVLLTVIVKRFIPRDAVPLALLARFVGPAILLTAVSFSLDPDPSFLTGRTVLMLAIGSFVGPFLSFFMVFTAMPLVRLGVQTLFQSLPIVFTSIVSYLVFGTIPTPVQYVGGAMILISVLLVGLTGPRPPGASPRPVAEFPREGRS